jgi:endogenous inhibitor of DNA gyrase (YacG/DUF329 family)
MRFRKAGRPRHRGNAVEAPEPDGIIVDHVKAIATPSSQQPQTVAFASRNAPVTCEACGKKVKRKARQQRFCSQPCRQRADYAKKVAEGHYTALPTNPSKKIGNINGLRGGKSGPSVFAKAPVHLLGGGSWHWPNAVRLDPSLRAKIMRAEIGGESGQTDIAGSERN